MEQVQALSPAERIAEVIHALSNPESPDGVSPTVAREAREKLAEAVEELFPRFHGFQQVEVQDPAHVDTDGKARLNLKFVREAGTLEEAVRQTLEVKFDGEVLGMRPNTWFCEKLLGDEARTPGVDQDWASLSFRPYIHAPSGPDADAVRTLMSESLDCLEQDKSQLQYEMRDIIIDELSTPDSLQWPEVDIDGRHPVLVLDTEYSHDIKVRIEPLSGGRYDIEGAVELVQVGKDGDEHEVLLSTGLRCSNLGDFFQEGVDQGEALVKDFARQVAARREAVGVLEENGYLKDGSRSLVATMVGRSSSGNNLYVDFGGGAGGALNEALATVSGEAETKKVEVTKGAGEKSVLVLRRSNGLELPEASVMAFLAGVNERLPEGKPKLEYGGVRVAGQDRGRGDEGR